MLVNHVEGGVASVYAILSQVDLAYVPVSLSEGLWPMCLSVSVSYENFQLNFLS